MTAHILFDKLDEQPWQATKFTVDIQAILNLDLELILDWKLFLVTQACLSSKW